MTHPRMAAVPDPVLRGPASELEAWCADNGFRPTWLDVDQERRARRQNTSLASAPEPPPRHRIRETRHAYEGA